MTDKIALEEFSWKEVSHRVKKVNPVLANLIDNLNPDDSYKLYLAKYPYGSNILVDGQLFFPTKNGKLIPFEDANVPLEIKHNLGYLMGTNPMTLVLSNTVELFISTENRIIPYRLIEQGILFGVWGILEYLNQTPFFTFKPLWDLTAGARSVFLLPKISEVAAFNKIQKKYNIKNDVPKRLSDHWYALKDIANHPNFEQPWEVELLYFSRKWIDSMQNPSWQDLKFYVFDLAWRSSDFWRSQFCWELTFSRIQTKRNIKPCPYVADIVSHLLATSVGALSGLQPLFNNHAAPINSFIKIFEDEYGTPYAPLIIGPANFNVFEPAQLPVYYSFHYQTAIKMSPKSSSRSSLINDMYQIRSLANKYIEDIGNSDLKISGTVLYEMTKKTQFTFGHYLSDNETKMTYSNDIILSDPSFIKALELCKVKELPKNAPFLNGCVQIAAILGE